MSGPGLSEGGAILSFEDLGHTLPFLRDFPDTHSPASSGLDVGVPASGPSAKRIAGARAELEAAVVEAAFLALDESVMLLDKCVQTAMAG